MRVTVTLQNGQARDMEIQALRVHFDQGSVDIELESSPQRIRLTATENQKQWQRFVLHPSAANLLAVETIASERGADL